MRTELEGIESTLRSTDWEARKRAVEEAGRLLRALPARGEVEVIAAAMVERARDPKWDVRLAVARQLRHLDHVEFDRIASILQEDDHQLVRRAGERAFRRRRRTLREQTRIGSAQASVRRRLEQAPAPVAQGALQLGMAYYSAAAATTAHDLKTVIGSVESCLTALERSLAGEPGADWREKLGKARRCCKLVVNIAEDMKTLADDALPTPTRERVRDLLEEALSLVRDRLPQRDPQVQLEVSPDLTAEVPRAQLLRALKNLLRNAFEAPACQEIQVRVEASRDERGELVLTIRDDGAGIAADDLGRVFLPGFTTKKDQPGRVDNTGMGLAIAHKAVEHDCGGSLELASGEGAGTTVTIRIPLQREQA